MLTTTYSDKRLTPNDDETYKPPAASARVSSQNCYGTPANFPLDMPSD